jgi:hypothetical protein
MSVIDQDGSYWVTENGWRIIGPFETNAAAWLWIDRHGDEGRDATARQASERALQGAVTREPALLRFWWCSVGKGRRSVRRYESSPSASVRVDGVGRR